MAMITAGTAKNAVMILSKTANAPQNTPMRAYMRNAAYCFEYLNDTEWGRFVSLYKGAAEIASADQSMGLNYYVRITLNDSSITAEYFPSTWTPVATGGTPLWTLSATDTSYLMSGTWTYDNTYYSLVSFTSNDSSTYTVNYNANGGSVTPTSATYSGTPLTLPTPTRAGYTFNGWYTAATGGTLVNSPYTPGANVTLYAQWTANSTGLPLYIGAQQVQKVYVGSQQVIHMYLGSTKIY